MSLANSASELARVFLYNLAFDLKNGHLPHEEVERFLERVEQATSADDVMVTIRRVLRSNESLMLLCPSAAEIGPVSRIMRARAFAFFHLNQVFDESCEAALSSVVAATLPSELDGRLRGPFAFYWAADKAGLDARLPSDSDDKADLAKHLLGLLFEAGVTLVRVDISEPRTEGGRFATPTSFDGYEHALFSPCARSDGWGQTMQPNLEPGVPEILAPEIHAGRAAGIEILGTTTIPTAIDYGELAEHAKRRFEAES